MHMSLLLGRSETRFMLKLAVLSFRMFVRPLGWYVCDGWENLDLQPQENTSNQDSRASLLNTQKNRKIKKPWNALRITKTTWNAVEDIGSVKPVTVSAPNSHGRPKRKETPMMLMRSLTALFWSICCFVWPIFFTLCLMSTLITIAKMTVLKSRMTKIGPRNVPKNNAALEMKQLEGDITTLSIKYLVTHSH